MADTYTLIIEALMLLAFVGIACVLQKVAEDFKEVDCRLKKLEEQNES